MPLRLFFRALLAAVCCLPWLAVSLPAQIPTAPVEGLRENPPRVHALINARLVIAPGKIIERGCLVVRDGLISEAGADVQPPADARVWDLAGKTVYAGFIDSYSHYGLPAKYQPRPLRPEKPVPGKPPTPADDAPAGSGSWNPLVTPQRDAARFFAPDEKAAEKLRALGFASVLSVPGRGIFRGVGTLVNLNGKSGNRGLLRLPTAPECVALEENRYDQDQYPDSLMGCIALIRQTFLDAGWYRQVQAFAAAKPGAGERPETNEALAALAEAEQGKAPVIFDAPDELDLLRALRVSNEFKLRPILRGAGYEYRVLDPLKKSGVPLIVPLAFPEAPEIETPEKALDVTLEELEHWNEAPANPGRLAKAGIPFALTLDGLDNPAKNFWPHLREVVKRGLSEADALAALTVTPARLLGAEARCGTLETGKSANFIVASGNLFADENAAVLSVWIDGEDYPTEKWRQKDPRGSYSVTFAGVKGPDALKIEGEPGKFKMTFGADKATAVAVQGEQLAILVPAKIFGGKDGAARLTAGLGETDAGGPLEGQGQMPDGQLFRWTARKTAAFQPPPKTDKEKDKNSAAAREIVIPPAYPAGAFGRPADEPAPADVILVQHATVWTSGPAGKLEDADLLVKGGKIEQVGKGLTAPAGARIIDATGQHVTPGLVDCHSHTAISRGVNEATHAVTCEVRVGDALDATDIGLYRELAGGLTTANVLHGSANPIGGQNQPIKLRWGSLPEDLKIAGAVPGVKFALGENVKQSNWGDRYTSRYPQTRMGVEQIMRDTFLAARDYERAWQDYKAKPLGGAMPPRRDLRLEAVLEILNRQRIVHIHSYRQDELLMFIRLSQELGFTIGTFQHVLEGYKVADEIAKIGAGASTFSDWWGYKYEVIDAIPYNGAMLQRAGVVTSFNSDSNELARHLNTEAAKAVKYGGLNEEEALNFVTINPARQLRLEKQIGSLEPGKDADFVIWNGSPLSTYTRAEQTWIEGRCYFDYQRDQLMRQEAAALRERLIQRALPERQKALGESGGDDEDKDKDGSAGKPAWAEDSIFRQRFIHGAIHYAIEHQGLYHNGANKHNCSSDGW